MQSTSNTTEHLPSSSYVPDSGEAIHVALALHDPSGNYSQHAGVVMTSIFENTKSNVIVHILHDDTLTEENRRKFIRTAEKYSQGLELHDITEYTKHISKDIVNIIGVTFTVGSLYRIVLQDIIPLDKVIYLDCDIVVNMDIRKLWEIDTDGKYIAAVLDEGTYKKHFLSYDGLKCWINGCKASSYINSGVLIMDLKAIRQRGDFFADAIQWLKSHLYSSNYGDQDVYNALFFGSIKMLDKKFNRQFCRFAFFDGSDLSDTVIHNIWPKPWNTVSADENCILYWDMFMRSAWGENLTPRDLVKILGKISSSSPELHKNLLQCLLYNFYKGLSILFNWLAAPTMIVKHIYHKLTRR